MIHAIQDSPHIIILAAGRSLRFGAAKQLAPVGGCPMLRVVASRAVAAAGHGVTVVLGADAALLQPLLSDLPVSIVHNPDFLTGMASSIRAGIAHVPGQATAALILLGDQAAVTRDDLLRLIDCSRRHPQKIAAAQYGDVIGAPAVFPRRFFGELTRLQGDGGARPVLVRHSDAVVCVPMPTAAMDVDTVTAHQDIGNSGTNSQAR